MTAARRRHAAGRSSRAVRDELRRLPRPERRAVRRAVRRGRRARVPEGRAALVAELARRRARRARPVLALAVALVLVSLAAGAYVGLRLGPGPLLLPPVLGLLLGGLAGVVSESRLRRAEDAEVVATRGGSAGAGADAPGGSGRAA